MGTFGKGTTRNERIPGHISWTAANRGQSIFKSTVCANTTGSITWIFTYAINTRRSAWWAIAICFTKEKKQLKWLQSNNKRHNKYLRSILLYILLLDYRNSAIAELIVKVSSLDVIPISKTFFSHLWTFTNGIMIRNSKTRRTNSALSTWLLAFEIITVFLAATIVVWFTFMFASS